MRSKKILACFFVFVIMAFLVQVAGRFSVRAFEKISPQIQNLVQSEKPQDETIDIEIDWEKLYPFDDNEQRPEITTPAATEKPIEELKENFFKKLYNYVKDRFEENTAQKLIGYNFFVKAAKKYEGLIDWNMTFIETYNPVIEMRGGYLTWFVESRDISASAEAVINFAEYCREEGSEFCYINLPFKICKYEDKNISGILDFSNQNADRFLARLDEAGIKTYDMRKFLHDDGMKHHEAFFRTDHHWRPETGLWAAGKILKFLRDDFGWPVNPEILDPKNFDYVVYPGCFIGSQGWKTLRVEPEDVSLIYPKFETKVYFEVPDMAVKISGDFSVTYNMKRVNNNIYAAYNHGRRPVNKTENYLAKNDKKILLVYDSFSDCVIPFLALGVKRIECVDLRSFTGSLKRYLDIYKPDMTIVIYTAEFPGTNTDYDRKLYDFR